MVPETNEQVRKVFVVDDHPLVREFLIKLINQQPDLVVCGEASEALEALADMDLVNPQAAIVDLSLEGSSGIDLIQEIKARRPDMAIVVLSMHDDFPYAGLAFRAGASAYVKKQRATREIIQALRCVLEGRRYFNEKVTASLIEKIAGKSPRATGPIAELLSEREVEVFELIGLGRTNRQIAQTMNVSLGTVQSHCARIKKKLKLANGNELICKAVRCLNERAPA
jgi:DNA-binding NarL/FixJ family response regulator